MTEVLSEEKIQAIIKETIGDRLEALEKRSQTQNLLLNSIQDQNKESQKIAAVLQEHLKKLLIYNTITAEAQKPEKIEKPLKTTDDSHLNGKKTSRGSKRNEKGRKCRYNCYKKRRKTKANATNKRSQEAS